MKKSELKAIIRSIIMEERKPPVPKLHGGGPRVVKSKSYRGKYEIRSWDNKEVWNPVLKKFSSESNASTYDSVDDAMKEVKNLLKALHMPNDNYVVEK